MRIALPYVCILAVFARDARGHVKLTHHNECFFRNAPLNGWDDPEMDGLYVLYGKTRKDKALAQVMHDAMWDPLMTTSPDPESFTDFGTRQFAAGVLLWSEIPSVLLESVFISNAQECALLTNGTGVRQKQIAQAVYDGLNAWFSQPPPTLPGKGK